MVLKLTLRCLVRMGYQCTFGVLQVGLTLLTGLSSLWICKYLFQITPLAWGLVKWH